MEFPTASDRQLGTGKWSGGPTGAVIYSEGPWLNGLLVSHLASFAGNRHRGDVNLTSIEPLVSYTLHSGWSVQCNPTISYDWTADSADAWTIPLGADVGKTFVVGSQALSVLVGAYDLVRAPRGRPDIDRPCPGDVPLPQWRVMRSQPPSGTRTGTVAATDWSRYGRSSPSRVARAGIEPATPRFSVACSTN